MRKMKISETELRRIQLMGVYPDDKVAGGGGITRSEALTILYGEVTDESDEKDEDKRD